MLLKNVPHSVPKPAKHLKPCFQRIGEGSRDAEVECRLLCHHMLATVAAEADGTGACPIDNVHNIRFPAGELTSYSSTEGVYTTAIRRGNRITFLPYFVNDCIAFLISAKRKPEKTPLVNVIYFCRKRRRLAPLH